MHEDHNAIQPHYADTLCDCRDYNCPAGAIPDLTCINADTRGAPDNTPCEDDDCPTCYDHACDIDWTDDTTASPEFSTDRIRRFLRRISGMQ